MAYPRTGPTASGMLDLGDGTSLYWEESGAPDGIPALWLHGGPGGSLGSGWYRTHFDPERYRLIGIDQRGSGRSRPLITESREQLAAHTTQRLIADIEAVRQHLGIEAWVVTGISWGTTLALAYAQQHPARVPSTGPHGRHDDEPRRGRLDHRRCGTRVPGGVGGVRAGQPAPPG